MLFHGIESSGRLRSSAFAGVRVFMISLVLLLQACAAGQGWNSAPKEIPEDMVPSSALDDDLMEAANTVSNAWAQLGGVYAAAHPSATALVDHGPPVRGLDIKVRVNWEGPIEPFLKNVLSTTGYHLVVHGSPSGIPILIALNGQYTVFDAVKEAGYQAGERAEVVVREPDRAVLLDYKSNLGASIGFKE